MFKINFELLKVNYEFVNFERILRLALMFLLLTLNMELPAGM